MFDNHQKALTTATVLAAAIVLVPLAADAFTFSEQCAPRTEHDTGLDSPNSLLILDRSGSMNTWMGHGMTRWQTAVQVMTEVVSDLDNPGPCGAATDETCDLLRFGIGYFSSSAMLAVDPDEDTAPAILSSLSATRANGQTQTHTGVELARDSSAMTDASRPEMAVLVTDGIPDLADTAQKAVRTMCEIRERGRAPIVSYVVGFGPGSNERVNGFFAAAGGTGTCCAEEDWPCSNPIDPCDMSADELDYAVRDRGYDDSTYIHHDYNCGGNYEATDGEALKRALLQISEEALCTFRLEIPGDYPTQSADEDPEGTLVEMHHDRFGPVRLPYCDGVEGACDLSDRLQSMGVPASVASGYADDGWHFLDPARKYVRLSDGLCGDVGDRAIDTVVTQVACVCLHTGQPCTVTLDGFTQPQLDNMRCARGIYECIDGEDVCVAPYGEMPEICNGIDDDCDGEVDNMRESWEKPQYQSPEYRLPPRHEGLDCRRRDHCVCPEGPDEVGGLTPEEFYDSWEGTCYCGSALSGSDAPQTDPDDGGPAEPWAEDGTCLDDPEDVPLTSAGGIVLMLLLGAAALLRRLR